jgi:uncharacterized membrane protein
MLNGITILNEFIKDLNAGNLVWGILIGIIALVCLIGIIVSIITSEHDGIGWAIVGLIILGAISIGLLLNSYYKPQTQYQVTISDEVKMQEFNSKYEVISQEGQIFTITEK